MTNSNRKYETKTKNSMRFDKIDRNKKSNEFKGVNKQHEITIGLGWTKMSRSDVAERISQFT